MLATLIDFVVENQTLLLGLAGVLLPTLITGLTKYPQAAGALTALLGILNRLSVVSHSDSPGTFKLPGTVSKPPAPTQGFARLGLLALLAAACLLAAPAFAEDPPPLPIPTPTRSVGGCMKNGIVCFGPSVGITMTAYDVTHKTVIGGFSPGLGYGVTFWPNSWASCGIDLYLSMQTGPQEGITFAGMVKFAGGYLRIGVARQILSGGPTATLIPAGIGLDF